MGGGTEQPAARMSRDSVPSSHGQSLFLCFNPRREAERDLPRRLELAQGRPLGESGSSSAWLQGLVNSGLLTGKEKTAEK